MLFSLLFLFTSGLYLGLFLIQRASEQTSISITSSKQCFPCLLLKRWPQFWPQISSYVSFHYNISNVIQKHLFMIFWEIYFIRSSYVISNERLVVRRQKPKTFYVMYYLGIPPYVRTYIRQEINKGFWSSAITYYTNEIKIKYARGYELMHSPFLSHQFRNWNFSSGISFVLKFDWNSRVAANFSSYHVSSWLFLTFTIFCLFGLFLATDLCTQNIRLIQINQ